jgi:hypothetical protein
MGQIGVNTRATVPAFLYILFCTVYNFYSLDVFGTCSTFLLPHYNL